MTFWGEQLDPAPFFSAADAFIMSSTSEGLPISLLQAFSMGLPAIVTDVGGMAEAVQLADAGLIASKTDREHVRSDFAFGEECRGARALRQECDGGV